MTYANINELSEIIDPLLEEKSVDESFGVKVLRQTQLEKALRPLFAKYVKKGKVEEIKQAIISQAISYLDEELRLTQTKLEGIEETCWTYPELTR